MKFSQKLIFILLAGLAITYTGCKKSAVAPTSANSSQETVSSLIALNLAQSLTGSFGGASIKDGVHPSSSIFNSVKGRQLNSTTPCGFLTDTGINFKSNIGDTIKSTTTGSIRYFLTCANGEENGYTVSDSLLTTGTAPQYSFNYAISQNYTVSGINTNNSRIELNGSLKSFVDITYKKLVKNSVSVHNEYVFKDLEINQDDNFDMTSGTATFVSSGTNFNGGWSYTGSILFLGNHRLRLDFLGNIFYVDLTTGTVTEQ